MSAPVRKLRARLLDDFIETKLCGSYGWFLGEGVSRLPKEFYLEILYDIERINVGCELILAGFVRRTPMLIHIDCYLSIAGQRLSTRC